VRGSARERDFAGDGTEPAAKVVAGHAPSMRSYGSFLEEPQIRALIAYIVTLR
jgi:hypothetical protein